MRGNSKSEIDLVLIEEGSRHRINKLIIHEDGELGMQQSDHNWIVVSVKHAGGKGVEKEQPFIWDIREDTKWDRYREVLEGKLRKWGEEKEVGQDAGAIEAEYEALVNCMVQAAEVTVGRKKTGKKGIKRRTGGKLRKLIKMRNVAGTAWRRELAEGGDLTMVKWNVFKHRLAAVAGEWRKDLRRKRVKWRIKSLAKSSGNSRSIWRDLKVKKGRDDIRALKRASGETLVNPVEVRDEISRYMRQLGTEDQQEERGRGQDEIGEGRNDGVGDTMSEEITVEECSRAIRALKKGKAVGDDKIANELVKQGGPKLVEAITTIMEQIRQEEWIPAEWKRERVTLLHKGKSRMLLDNYRGIAIGSNMCKIFTRIIRTRVQEAAEDRGLLGEMQNGFRKGRSTNDNLFVLSQLMERAQRGGRRGDDMLLVFIDLRKAYDRSVEDRGMAGIGNVRTREEVD